MRACLLRVKSTFNQQFKRKVTGLAKEFLNISTSQQLGRIAIDQEQYTRALLVTYDMYIGSRNYADDVPSMSEYIPHNAKSRIQ